MKKSVSTAVAGVALALTTSTLALVLPASSANAASPACVQASSAAKKSADTKTAAGRTVLKARKANKAAKKAQAKANKAAVKAKKAKATTAKAKAEKKVTIKRTAKKLKAANKRVKGTKARLARANATYRSKVRYLSSANTAKANACKPVAAKTPETEAMAAVMQLILKNMADQNDVSLLGKEGVKGLLNSVAPDLGNLVGDDLLGNVVAMLHNPIHSATDASKMFSDAFGQYLDPAVLAGGMGSFDPAQAAKMFEAMFTGMIGEYAPAGFKIPKFDATMATGMLAQMANLANPDMLKGMGLGDFTKIFEGMMSGKLPSGMDMSQLSGLVKMLNPSQLQQLKGSGILGAVIGGLTEGAGGLPGLGSIPVLGPILTGVLNTLKGLLCGVAGPLC